MQNCRLQIGGSDQWGNIVGGIELVRRAHRAQVYGLTVPLLTTASGEKIGKSAGNALWVDGSPFELYQYLYNLPDEDASSLLTKLTLLPLDQCEIITAEENRDQRRVQKELALWIIGLLFGDKGVASVRTVSLFFDKNFDTKIKSLSAQQARQFFHGCESVKLNSSSLQALDVLSLAIQHNLSPSKAEIRRIMKGEGVRVCGSILKENHKLSSLPLIGGRFLTLRIGKKVLLIEIQD